MYELINSGTKLRHLCWCLVTQSDKLHVENLDMAVISRLAGLEFADIGSFRDRYAFSSA